MPTPPERRALVLYAHPNARSSRAGSALRAAVEQLPNVTFHDLYAAYPDFLIDVKREQELLLEHDLVVFQHPFYWYSSPPLLKLWQDDVLEHGWAYGDGGTRLHGKFLWSVITTGGPAEAYGPQGYNRFGMRALLAPFDQTAHLCGMRYAEPLVIHSVRRLGEVELAASAEAYRQGLLRFLAEGECP
jgi:glutathione-regulated potassium-efflux system ancillary protein KefG